jgi:hypothetical protein
MISHSGCMAFNVAEHNHEPFSVMDPRGAATKGPG